MDWMDIGLILFDNGWLGGNIKINFLFYLILNFDLEQNLVSITITFYNIKLCQKHNVKRIWDANYESNVRSFWNRVPSSGIRLFINYVTNNTCLVITVLSWWSNLTGVQIIFMNTKFVARTPLRFDHHDNTVITRQVLFVT